LALFLVRTLRPVPLPVAPAPDVAPVPRSGAEAVLESKPATEEEGAAGSVRVCVGETELRPLEMDERVRLAGDGVRWVDISGDSEGGERNRWRQELWEVSYSNMDQSSAHVKLMI
jgi:hypothetical protein